MLWSPTPARVVVGAVLVALPILLVRCGIGDLVNPGEGGRLAVSTGSLVQSAAVGSQALRTVTVDITSASGRAVGWSAQRTGGGAWLSLTPTAGTVPSTVTVTFDPADLAVGEFRDTIEVRADGSDAAPLRVPVTFTIEECALSPATVGGGDVAGTLSAADCGAPNRAGRFARVYVFDGVAGDSVTVVLSSTAFDPYLVMATPGEATPSAAATAAPGGQWRWEREAGRTDDEISPHAKLQSAVRAGLPLVESADCPFSPADACLVNVPLPEDGTYLIEVTTEQPGETGAFTLNVSMPRDPAEPGLGGLGVGQFQLGGVVQIPQGEGLAGTEGVLKARMSDPDGFDSLRLEVEVELVGTPFDDTPTAVGAVVANRDTAVVSIAGLTDAAAYHWQARAVDNTGRAGPWRAFGTNNDPDGVDFFTVVSRLPDLPSGLVQARTDGTAIAVGSTTPERQVRISASVSDPDGDDVRIEAEVKPVGTDFDGTPSGASAAVASGGTATFTVGGLVDGVSYKWRARAADANNLFSDWVEFGGNGDEADFVVDVGASGVDPGQSSVATDVTTISADGGVATITVTARNALGEVVVGAMVALTATGTGNTITQPGNTDANGQAVGTLSSTGAGDKVVTAAADGVTITQTVTITVTPGAANAAQTTADVPSGTAGVATPITVTVRDANGNQLASGGETVVVSVTGANTATPTVTDNGDGTYTASYTPSATGTDNVDITLNGTAINGSPFASTVSSGVADPSQTTADVPDGTAGSATVITVTTRDANGNPLTTGGQTVVVDVTGANTATPAVTDHNDGTYSANYTPTAAGDDVVEITLNGTEINGSPYTSVVAPATGDQLSITTQPSASAQSGVAFSQQPVIRLLDQFNNPVTQSGVEVTALIFSGGGTIGGTNAVQTDGNGVATFTDLSISGTTGDRVLTFVASGFSSVNSSTISITPGPAAQLFFTVQPVSTVAGADIPAITVTARDAAGNTATGFTGDITIGIGTNPPGTGMLDGTVTLAATAGVATFSGLNIDEAGNGYTLTASATNVTGATSNAFNITASQLTFSVQPVTTVAGVNIPAITVTALDAAGNTATNFSGSVVMTIGTNPSSGVLDGTTTITAGGGVATFTTLNIDEAGDGYTLVATSGSLTVTSNAFNITASQLVFTTQPVTTVAGATIPSVVVTARDANGNTATNFAGSVVMTIGTNPPGNGVLDGTTTVTASSGVATFSALDIDEAGNGYTLVATSGSLTTTSSAFNITASQLVFTTQPVNTAAGATIPSVVVTARDANGNTATNFTGSVVMTIGTNPPGNGVLDGTTTVTAVSGVATFSALDIDEAGDGYTLVATSGSLTVTSAAFNITANVLVFTTQPVTTVAGVNIPSVVVTAQDALGNTLTSFTGDVTVAIGTNPPGNGVLDGTVTVAAVAGVATFTTLNIDEAGNGYTLTASATNLSGATSAAFNITASQLVFTTQPVTTVSGATMPAVVVTARDANGNTATNFVGSVVMTIGANPPGNGVLDGTTMVTAASGVATFSALDIDEAGDGYTLVATSGSLMVTSSAFNITASQLVFTTQPTTTTAGATMATVTVTAQDVNGITATNFIGNVTLAFGTDPTGGTAVLTGGGPAAAVAGVATFGGISIDVAATGYTLVASATGPASATSTAFDITAP